jgi:hypothetical protein
LTAGGDTTALMPPSPMTNRQSRAQSSYAGSLYDMYIDGADDERTPQFARQSTFGNGHARASMGAALNPEGRSHIEVTERADGSVVWQVIAGLADRSSAYSGSFRGAGHSRQASDSSEFSFRPRDSTYEDLLPAEGNGTPVRSFAGLTNDDSRSFFARSRGKVGHRKSWSFDASTMPALPKLPELSNASGAVPHAHTEDAAEDDASHDPFDMPPIPSPSLAAAAEHPTPHQKQYSPPLNSAASPPQQQLGFDMATPSADASATRIVYTNDNDLAMMLESLARDNSAAKFEFSRVPGGNGPDARSLSRPVSSWTGSSVDSGEARTQRLRIEAEIFSLLSHDQRGMVDLQAAAASISA